MSHPWQFLPTLAVFCALGTVAQASSYTITALGTLPGTNQSFATGINDLGQVVGYSNNASDGQTGNPQAWVYSNGQLTPVTPIGGGVPNAINDSGQVVGGQNVSINNSGQYVGELGSNSTGVYSGLFSGGTVASLGNLDATTINNSGLIGGSVYNPATGGNDPALYKNGQVTDLAKTFGLNTTSGTVVALNNSGDAYVLYMDQSNQPEYRILKANGQTTSAYSDSSPYSSMNSSLQLVGRSNIFQNGYYTDLLNLLPVSTLSLWQGLSATAINDAGQIVGVGQLADGQNEAFLMTPVATPEPSTLAVLTAGATGLTMRSVARRSRRRCRC